MNKKSISPAGFRTEAEIFADLQTLCCSPGFIHAIAYFCWRDNYIKSSGKQLTADDVRRQYSHDRLARTEISTLVGLMVKEPIDLRIPSPQLLQTYLEKSAALLREMQNCLQTPWIDAFFTIERNPHTFSAASPFSSADGLREPIFYSGESAYNFQYTELAAKKYRKDNNWLITHRTFSIEEACFLAAKLGALQVRKLSTLSCDMMTLPPDQWTFLPGFVFFTHELQDLTGMEANKIERIIDAFTCNLKARNSSFCSLSDFNETNAAPIIRLENGSNLLMQHYSLLEALYESPFFWMGADKTYLATAFKHRGEFAEEFLAERFSRVFGEGHVFQNVDIYRGKDRVTEADVLVTFGDRAIVIQTKSKRLTIEARRGNDLQLKDDFKKAIGESYNQALQFSNALLDKDCRLALANGDELLVNSRPTKIFPVCAVLDHYPALSAQVRNLLKISCSKHVQPPLVTDIFFLDVLTELLNTPLHLINYIELRAKFDGKLLVNQELATLGYHLTQSLWVEIG